MSSTPLALGCHESGLPSAKEARESKGRSNTEQSSRSILLDKRRELATGENLGETQGRISESGENPHKGM